MGIEWLLGILLVIVIVGGILMLVNIAPIHETYKKAANIVGVLTLIVYIIKELIRIL